MRELVTSGRSMMSPRGAYISQMPHQPTPRQLEAIEAEMGPVLVIAGPGAGKTFSLIERIRYLIEVRGLAPERICAVTFTNKAAEEVATRLKTTLGARSEEVTRGTLHSLCLSMLREFGHLLGLKTGFGIADDDYQRQLLRRLDVWPAKRHGSLLNLFGRRRREGRQLSPEDEKVYRSYRRYLQSHGLVDFDDIIGLARDLLLEEEAAAQVLARRWSYLLVDEFQDLSRSQYDILRLLVADHGNLFGVGDDEQSIFSWTGADPQILSVFQSDFEIADPVVLDENRRCSDRIFAAARNLLRANPDLFEKRISAPRQGKHDVRAHSFPTEIEEGNWLVTDIMEDRDRDGFNWGDIALVYRKHRTGGDLERRLLQAGIPCRLARGRALLDDRVVAYVIGSLRLMVAGDDPVALEAFAAKMLSAELMESIRAAIGSPADFVEALRSYARSRKGDADGKKVWRLVYHYENMRAMYRSHQTLAGLVEDLLTEMRGPFRNKLEDHHEDLSDPAAYPGAEELARRIENTVEQKSLVWLAPMKGLEIALLGMFIGSGLPVVCRYLRSDSEPRDADLVLGSGFAGNAEPGLLLFKALQVIVAREFDRGLKDFVAFDLETTDKDVAECEVVEIGAVRVRAGEIAAEFQALVRPQRAISARATEVHGYTSADVADSPSFDEVWPRFLEFVGDDVMVAHNGQHFDVPVLRRAAGTVGAVEDMVFYDTLPLARSLFQGSARLEDLADRFGVPKGRAHHAADDAGTLASVVASLNSLKLARSRKCALANVLDFLALSLVLDSDEPTHRGERQVLFQLARINALGAFSECLDFYSLQREATVERDTPSLDAVIERLGGDDLRRRLQARRSNAERFPLAVARLRSLVESCEAETVEQGVNLMLERAALSTSDGVEAEPHRVNLLTLHSTKGLEFSRVYVIGVEDTEIPGWREIKYEDTAAIQEARRLVYVGMTRAIDRLVLTRVDERFGNFSGGNRFLNEIGVAIEHHGTSADV